MELLKHLNQKPMNRLLSILLTIFGFLMTDTMVGQQQLPVSKHPDDLYVGNPAARNSWFYIMGDSPSKTFNFYYRKQWHSQVKGTPMTVGGSFDYIFGYNENHLGSIETRLSSWGSMESFQFKGRYAINLNGAFGGGKKYSFYLGTAVEIESLRLDFEKISFNNPNEPIQSQSGIERGSYPKISVGGFGHIHEKLLYGVSITQWFAIRERTLNTIPFNQHPQWLGNLSYIGTISSLPNTYLELSTAVSYVKDTPINWSLIIRPYVKTNSSLYSIGVGYVKNSIQLEFNWIEEEKFRIGSSIDLITLATYSPLFNNFSTYDIKFAFFIQ